jgi:hypothetical protein
VAAGFEVSVPAAGFDAAAGLTSAGFGATVAGGAAGVGAGIVQAVRATNESSATI